jgi:dihydroneopterin triphosphate diphosphatase
MDENKKIYKQPESVLVVIYSKTGHVLMMQRAFPEEFWQSVTGSLEWGEQAHEAAVRELKEETGLEAEGLIDCQVSQEFEIYSIWRDRYEPGIARNREHVFLLPLESCAAIKFDPREHSEIQWVSREEAIQMATSHTNSEAIARWVPED